MIVIRDLVTSQLVSIRKITCLVMTVSLWPIQQGKIASLTKSHILNRRFRVVVGQDNSVIPVEGSRVYSMAVYYH